MSKVNAYLVSNIKWEIPISSPVFLMLKTLFIKIARRFWEMALEFGITGGWEKNHSNWHTLGCIYSVFIMILRLLMLLSMAGMASLSG